MKKLAGLLLLSLMFVAGVVVGNNIPAKEAVAQTEKRVVAYQVVYDGECQVTFEDGSSESFFIDEKVEKSIEVESIEYTNGDTIINFTDGSYALYNEEKKEYIFQHYELGDWDLELNSARELEMVIKTFLNIE